MNAIRVVIVDDHQLFRDGVRALLGSSDKFTVVGDVANGRDVIEIVKRTHPEIVIMDIGMPELNGIDAARLVKKEFGEVKIVCLSMHDRSQYVREAFRAGADGYVLKDAAFDELVRAITEVRSGHTYISPAVGEAVVNAMTSERAGADGSLFDVLTLREREILQLFAEGRTTKEIAADLRVSVKTVASHREKIMDKLQARSVVDLTKRAIREGLVQLD